MTDILIPTSEPAASRRGRAAILQMNDRILELYDRGKEPVRALISTAIADDMRAYFDFNFVFDGVLPRDYCGVELVYVPGADRHIHIEVR